MKVAEKWFVRDESGVEQVFASFDHVEDDELVDVTRRMMQDVDEVYNYVIIDGRIYQFESLNGYLGDKEDPSEDDLQCPWLWDTYYAVRVWSIVGREI